MWECKSAISQFPAKTLLLAFAVCVLHSSCPNAVAGLLGGCFAGWQCVMTEQVWTGQTCNVCAGWSLSKTSNIAKAKTRFADTVYPLAYSVEEINLLPLLNGSVACFCTARHLKSANCSPRALSSIHLPVTHQHTLNVCFSHLISPDCSHFG